jgi:hypothetical protein
VLNPCTFETFSRAVEHASQTKPAEIERQSLFAREVIEEHYRPRNFIERWKAILNEVAS